jgi:diamine N-acetyltransferase
MTMAWRNQDHIRVWFGHADLLTWEQHKNWCAQYFRRDNDFIFIIEETRDLHKPVGQISLYNIDWDQRRAEYGRLLIGEPEAAGKGLAKEATQVLLDYAFGRLGLTEVALEVFGTNLPAIAIYQAYGFREVGESGGMKRMVKAVGGPGPAVRAAHDHT